MESANEEDLFVDQGEWRTEVEHAPTQKTSEVRTSARNIKRAASEYDSAYEDGHDEDHQHQLRNYEHEWGANIQAPRPAVPRTQYIMGKQAGSYTMEDIRFILQHFGWEKRVGLGSTKDDLLHVLVDLTEDKLITAKERRWILRQKLNLGAGGLRFQTLTNAGNPASDSFPEGHGPKSPKRRKTAAVRVSSHTVKAPAVASTSTTGLNVSKAGRNPPTAFNNEQGVKELTEAIATSVSNAQLATLEPVTKRLNQLLERISKGSTTDASGHSRGHGQGYIEDG